MNRPQRGFLSAFTLVELLIVIVIISFLVLQAWLNVPGILAKARDAERKSDLDSLSKYLEDYNDSSGGFPSDLPNCGESLTSGSATYISDTPCDPQEKTDYVYMSDSTGFRLYTNLENRQDSSIWKVKCYFGCGPDCRYNYGVSSTNINLENCLPDTPLYACSPGGGHSGTCEAYDDPYLSQCPQVYADDPTCDNQCRDPQRRCRNASGKHVPE